MIIIHLILRGEQFGWSSSISYWEVSNWIIIMEHQVWFTTMTGGSLHNCGRPQLHSDTESFWHPWACFTWAGIAPQRGKLYIMAIQTPCNLKSVCNGCLGLSVAQLCNEDIFCWLGWLGWWVVKRKHLLPGAGQLHLSFHMFWLGGGLSKEFNPGVRDILGYNAFQTFHYQI